MNLAPLRKSVPRISQRTKLQPQSANDHSSVLDPIVDVGLSDAFQSRKYRAFHGRNVELKSAPPIPSAGTPAFRGVLHHILNSCHEMCNFVYVDADVKAKEVKMAMLEELNQLLKGEDHSALKEEDITLFLGMIEKNISRNLVHPGYRISWLEECPNMLSPGWPHTKIVYEILIEILRKFPESIPLEFIYRVIYLLNSPDANERTQMTFFIGGFCMQRRECCEAILIKLIKMLIDHEHHVIPPFSVGPVLEILITLFKWGIGESVASELFQHHIIPLIADDYLIFFITQLIPVLDHFMNSSPAHVNMIIDAIVKYWPKTRLSKQIRHLNIMSKAFVLMSQKELQARIPKMFAIYTECMTSPASKLADAAFAFWNSLDAQAIITIFSKQIFPLVVPTIAKVTKSHWSDGIRRSAMKGMNFVMKTDARYVDTVSLRPLDAGLTTWNSIVTAACAHDKKIRQQEKLKEIDKMFRTGEDPKVQGNRGAQSRSSMHKSTGNLPAKPRVVVPKIGTRDRM